MARGSRIPRTVLLLLSVTACARGTGRLTPSVPQNYERITASEIRGAATAYDALMRMAPLLVGWRATLLANGPVYLDEERLASAMELRTVPTGAVREIRFLNAITATTRFRTGHPLGAIEVVTTSARPAHR